MKLNLEENEARLKKSKEGEGLKARIENRLAAAIKKGAFIFLDQETFYQEIFEKGVPFQLRRGN